MPPQGEGYPGLLAAHARAIDLLADRIAATITGRPVELTASSRPIASDLSARKRQAG